VIKVVNKFKDMGVNVKGYITDNEIKMRSMRNKLVEEYILDQSL